MRKVRVLVVDDSAIMRKMLTRLLEMDERVEVVGAAPDPYVARDKMVLLKPDVLTLDVEMPRMDGISFLYKVMKNMPTAVVVISSLTTEGSETALKALEAGAVEVIAKPKVDIAGSLGGISETIVSAVLRAAEVNIAALAERSTRESSAKSLGEVQKTQMLGETTDQILAIGASTGGTNAIRDVLGGLEVAHYGIVIVQHMPPNFTKAFAKSLNDTLPFVVKEAEEGERIAPGKVLLAPGNFHLEVRLKGGYYYVVLHQKERVHSVRPAADYMFSSVAKYAGKNSLGVILTGMGKDGASGLLEMKKAGAYTLAQDKESCVVFGMPKVAIEYGAVDRILPLNEIAQEINRHFVAKSRAA